MHGHRADELEVHQTHQILVDGAWGGKTRGGATTGRKLGGRGDVLYKGGSASMVVCINYTRCGHGRVCI